MFREHEPNFIERAVIAVENISFSFERIAEALEGIEAKTGTGNRPE